MAWEHCGAALTDDQPACPACGVTKESWTVEFNLTRQFVVTRRNLVRLALVDGERPIAGERYVVRFTDGSEVRGELDDEGRAKVAAPGPGEAEVEFPARAPGDIALRPPRADADEEGGDEGADEASAPATTDTPGRFRCAIGQRRHTFEVGGVLRLLIDDASGTPMRDRRYELRAGERTVPGRTDADGFLEERIPAGVEEVHVSFPLGDDAASGSYLLHLRVGTLADAAEAHGVQGRLRNLGFPCGRIDGRVGPRTKSALMAFQRAHELGVTGEADEATLAKLREVSGC